MELTCSVDVLMVTGGGGGIDTVQVGYWKCSGYVLALYQCCIAVLMVMCWHCTGGVPAL